MAYSSLRAWVPARGFASLGARLGCLRGWSPSASTVETTSCAAESKLLSQADFN